MNALNEVALRERALAASSNGIMIVDMRAGDGVLVYVNAAFEAISGYAADDVLGHNPRLLYGSDSSQSGLIALRRAIKAHEGCRVKLRNYRKDGTLFWAELSLTPVLGDAGTMTHYIGAQSDISAFVGAQDALRDRSERLNAVFDLSPDGLVVIDKDEFISIVNPAFERLTGLTAIGLVGRHRNVLDLLLRRRCLPDNADGAGRPAFIDTEPADIDGTGEIVAAADVLRLALPHRKTLLRRTRRSKPGVGDTVVSFRDITREAEIDQMKSDFLATAAHELRTPMTSIYGFTELLLRRRFDESESREIIATVHKQARLLVNLVNELLDLARIESRRGAEFKREVQSLDPIIKSAVASLLMIGDTREVIVAERPEPMLVDIDREKLTLALTNVLSNAFKYSPEGGDIRVDLLDRRRHDVSEIGVQVSDQGIGMSDEQVSHIFERFFRADTSGGIPGTGLGMSIAKEIVELQGGEVTVHSAVGVGTRVTIWLPICRPRKIRMVREA